MKKLARLRAAVVGAGRWLARASAILLPVIARDAAGILGAGLVSYGMWLIYPPYGFITGGALLLVAAVLSSLASPASSGA